MVSSVPLTVTTPTKVVSTVVRPLLVSEAVVYTTRVRAQKSCDLLSRQTSTEASEIKRLFDVPVLLALTKEGDA